MLGRFGACRSSFFGLFVAPRDRAVFRVSASAFHLSSKTFCASAKKKKKEKFDPHQVLNVLETASDEEIRKQYRSLAKKYHPDVNKAADAQQKFQELQRAYNMIKDESAREKTRVKEELGDSYEGFDIDQIPEEFRTLVLGILECVRDKKSVLNRITPASIVYEVLKLRKTDFPNFTAKTVRLRFPHYISMASDDHWSPKEKVVFHMFDRELEQNLLGIVTFDLTSNTMDWTSSEGRLIATASLTNSFKGSALSQDNMFMVKSEGKVIGTFAASFFTPLPLRSLIGIHLPERHLPPIEGTHFCCFGSHTTWLVKGQGPHPAATAKRQFGLPFGRIFDIDIGTHHGDVHPALYLFNVAYLHSLERKFGIVYHLSKALFRRIELKLQDKKQTEKE